MSTRSKLFCLFLAGVVLVGTYFILPLTAFRPTTVIPRPTNNPLPPTSEKQAVEEIVSFMLDFIVIQEIGGTAEYVRSNQMPWFGPAPKVNIITFYSTPDSTSTPVPYSPPVYLDYKNPISVWWYTKNRLVEMDDKQKAIDEYYKKYVENSPGGTFVWGIYSFGILEVSPDFQSAEVYMEVHCGPLCGHGVFYKIKRNLNGAWEIYDSGGGWIS